MPAAHPIDCKAAPLDIRPLNPAHVLEALRLSTQAGWNQIAEDWHRLIDLWPDGCLGGWMDTQLVGTATLASYGRQIGWIGMILVDQAFRGHGFGTDLFRATLQRAATLGLQHLGLDATDLGRGLYLKHGFSDQGGIDRWAGPAAAPAVPRIDSVLDCRDADVEALLKLDQQAVGIDRSSLLRRLQDEPRSLCRVMFDGRDALAAGLARRGHRCWSIGPMLARRPEAAAAITAELLRDIAQQDRTARVYVDVPCQSPLAAILPMWGMSVERRLSRMTRPHSGEPILSGPLVAAAAGFELG